MSEITVEKKLELMRQIRSRNERDRFDMSRREQIVYGKSMGTMAQSLPQTTFMDDEDYEEQGLPTFPLRALLSVALFLLIIICDLSGKSFLGINANQCFAAISKDYESSITAWVDAASENSISD